MASAKSRKKVERKVFEPLTLREKEVLVRVSIRDQEFYTKTTAYLKADQHFRADDELWLGAVWAAVLSYHREQVEIDEDNVQLPDDEQLLTHLEKVVANADEDDIDDEDVEVCDHFIRRAFSFSKERIAKEKRLAPKYLERILGEGMQFELREAVSGETIQHLPSLLTEMSEKATVIQAIGLSAIDVPFPEEEEDTPLEKIPTGCGFLDYYMGGGQAGGEVYGLCAPFGVCKTTLAVQLAANRVQYEQSKVNSLRWNPVGKGGFWTARRANERVQIETPNLKRVYMVFYEETIKSIRIRVQSYAGGIERHIIEDRRFKDFTTKENGLYKDYEVTDIQNQAILKLIERGAPFSKFPDGEKERFEQARAKMNLNLRILDFTGRRPEYREAAADMAKGIRMIIDKDQAEAKNPGVSMVIVDYAGAAADRCMEANNLNSDELRHLIAKMPLRLKTHIAMHYDCPVWVMHQLNATANARSAGLAPKNTDAAEAKNFFEHVDFGFLIGTKSDQSLAVLRNGKQRREAIRKDIIIRVDGLMCRVEEARGYVLDGARIMDASEYNRVYDVEKEPAQETDNRYNNLYEAGDS